MTICQIRKADIDELYAMLDAAYAAIGRDIVHGQFSEADARTVAENVRNTVETCVLNRWASKFFEHVPEGLHPNDVTYPDDEQFEDAYADNGFERE